MTEPSVESNSAVLDGLVKTLAACHKQLDAFDATLKALGEMGAVKAAICIPGEGARGTELVVRLSIGMDAASNKILCASRPGVTAVRAAFRDNAIIDIADYTASQRVPTDLEEKLGINQALALPIRNPATKQPIGAILLVPHGDVRDRRALGDAALLAAERMAGILPAMMPLKTSAAERKASILPWRGAMLAAIQECLQLVDIEALSDRVLQHCRSLCEAEFGFVGYIEPSTGYLVAPTMTRDIFDQCRVAGKTVVFEKAGGLGGLVLERKEAVLANDPFSHPGSVGTPPGHLPIRRFLGVPCLFQGEVRGMIALANKETDFDSEDLGIASLFASIYAAAVAHHFSEEDLRQSRNRFSQLYDEAPCGYITLTPGGLVTQANETILRLLGYAPTEMVEKIRIDQLMEAEDLAVVNAQLARAKSDGAAGSAEVAYLTKGGERIHLLQSCRIDRDDRGYLQAIRYTLVDITDLRRVNRAIRTLSACNQALVRARDEAQLLETMCSEIVIVGQYPFACVSYLTPDGGLHVKATSGSPCQCIRDADGVRISQEAMKLVRASLFSDAPQIIRNLPTPPTGTFPKGECSLISLPLAGRDGTTIGALAILARDTGAFADDEKKLLIELAADLSYGVGALRTGVERSAGQEALKRSLEQVIHAIGATVESRDPYTAGHQRRVAELATSIASELELSAEEIHAIHLAAIIHDIGKISVPSEILNRPGHLPPGQFELIKLHPQTGHDIIKNVEFPWPVAEMILQHHEKLDGSGYPNGVKGDRICLGARIIAVADIVEAMASHRPYRPALSEDAALAEIEDQAGKTLDPVVVGACLTLFREKKFRWSTP